MDYEKSQFDHYLNYQSEQRQEDENFQLQTTKKPLTRQNNFNLEEPSATTDRVYSHTQRPEQPQYTDRTNSYMGETSEYQFLIYENKIHLLTDRLQCYMDQVENLKKTNAILIGKLSTIETLDEELQNQKLKNLQLRQQLQTYRDNLQDQKNDYEDKINQLKTKLQEKDHFIELVRDQNAKLIKKKDQQISFLKQALKEKTYQLDSYEKQLHSIQIERLNTSEDFSSRDSLFTKNSAMSHYNMRNSEGNTMTMNQSTTSVQQKALQFMKKNPTELKIAMKSISHAQKCLEMGGQQISTIMVDKENEKSLINMSRLEKFKVNKTYYK